MNENEIPYSEQTIQLQNPYLEELKPDYLYHLGLNSDMELEKMFGDVKYVCMGGSGDRAKVFAEKAAQMLGLNLDEKDLGPIGKTERFVVYKAGPILSPNHGMGMGSVEILLNEVAKLLYYAKAKGVKFIRLGTSGGIGVEGGDVVITDKAYNDRLEPCHDASVCGETMLLNTDLDPELAQEIFNCRGQINAVIGHTAGATGFYAAQGRIDGAIVHHTKEQKDQFIRKAHGLGVRNMEMEAPQFASFTKELGIKSAIVCSALLNRMNGDQVTATPAQLAEFADNSHQIVLSYIKKDLGLEREAV